MKTRKIGAEIQGAEKLQRDEAFGVIPLRSQNKVWEVFIIQHKAGHGGFPKGHRNDPHESDKEAAERELKEETGFSVKSYYSFEPFVVNYECVSHGRRVNKFVTFFVAEVRGQMQLCPDEIAAGQWATLDEARRKISFENMKLIIEQLQKLLKI